MVLGIIQEFRFPPLPIPIPTPAPAHPLGDTSGLGHTDLIYFRWTNELMDSSMTDLWTHLLITVLIGWLTMHYLMYELIT